MPTYSFQNKVTGQTFDRFLKISEREQYLKDNPDIVAIPTSCTFALYDGKRQPDEGFKDVLRNIREKAIGGKHLQSKYL